MVFLSLLVTVGVTYGVASGLILYGYFVESMMAVVVGAIVTAAIAIHDNQEEP